MSDGNWGDIWRSNSLCIGAADSAAMVCKKLNGFREDLHSEAYGSHSSTHFCTCAHGSMRDEMLRTLLSDGTWSDFDLCTELIIFQSLYSNTYLNA